MASPASEHSAPPSPLPSDQEPLQIFVKSVAGDSRHLSDSSKSLSELSIVPGSTIHLAAPLRGGTGGSKKPKCTAKDCKERAQPIVGDCGFCKAKFCAKHRMLESHSCPGLEDCKDQARERNRSQLEKERTRPQATV